MCRGVGTHTKQTCAYKLKVEIDAKAGKMPVNLLEVSVFFVPSYFHGPGFESSVQGCSRALLSPGAARSFFSPAWAGLSQQHVLNCSLETGKARHWSLGLLGEQHSRILQLFVLCIPSHSALISLDRDNVFPFGAVSISFALVQLWELNSTSQTDTQYQTGDCDSLLVSDFVSPLSSCLPSFQCYLFCTLCPLGADSMCSPEVLTRAPPHSGMAVNWSSNSRRTFWFSRLICRGKKRLSMDQGHVPLVLETKPSEFWFRHSE